MSGPGQRIRQIIHLSRKQGVGRTLLLVWQGGVVKRCRSRLNFARYGSRYPRNVIFIVGLGKSGSTWMAEMFASIPGFDQFTPVGWHVPGKAHVDAMDLYEGFENEFARKLAVVKGHTWGKAGNLALLGRAGLPYLITMRDPRDVIISSYYYIRKDPAHFDHHNTRGSLGDYIQHKLKSGEFDREVLDWMRLWTKDRDPGKSLILRYEDMLERPEESFRHALDFLGIILDDAAVGGIVRKNSFAEKTRRVPGTEDVNSFRRKGISGEWREVLSEEQKRLFAGQGEDVIRSLGYPATFPESGGS
jgi:hypothetical protein